MRQTDTLLFRPFWGTYYAGGAPFLVFWFGALRLGNYLYDDSPKKLIFEQAGSSNPTDQNPWPTTIGAQRNQNDAKCIMHSALCMVRNAYCKMHIAEQEWPHSDQFGAVTIL